MCSFSKILYIFSKKGSQKTKSYTNLYILGIFLALKTTIINSVLVVTVTWGMGLSWKFTSLLWAFCLFDTVQSLEG